MKNVEASAIANTRPRGDRADAIEPRVAFRTRLEVWRGAEIIARGINGFAAIEAVDADLYLKVTKSKEPNEVVLAMLNDPDIEFSTTPLNVTKVFDFMATAGTIKERPASWHDLTFSNLHSANGS